MYCRPDSWKRGAEVLFVCASAPASAPVICACSSGKVGGMYNGWLCPALGRLLGSTELDPCTDPDPSLEGPKDPCLPDLGDPGAWDTPDAACA